MCQRQNTGQGGPRGRSALASPTFSIDFISLSSSKRRHLLLIYSKASFIALLPCREALICMLEFMSYLMPFSIAEAIHRALGKVRIRLKECGILCAPSQGSVLQSALSHTILSGVLKEAFQVYWEGCTQTLSTAVRRSSPLLVYHRYSVC